MVDSVKNLPLSSLSAMQTLVVCHTAWA